MWGKDTPGREKGKGKGLEAGLAWHVLEITRRPVWLEGPEVWEEQRGERVGCHTVQGLMSQVRNWLLF